MIRFNNPTRPGRIGRMMAQATLECAECKKTHLARKHTKGDGSEHLGRSTIKNCKQCERETTHTVIGVSTCEAPVPV